jgi:hypothetical protein
MRDDVLADLVDRAMTDADFRRRAADDLDGTLQAEGFRLEPDELAAVREFHAQVAGKSDEEVDALVADAGRRQQAGG